MDKLLIVIAFVFSFLATSSAQMPPPGYERAKKMEEERQKMSRMERDSFTLIDTAVIFDPNTYEEEVIVTQFRISLRDYCIRYLGMNNPDILLDGKPHTIIDPKTYEDIRIRLTPDGKIERIPE